MKIMRNRRASTLIELLVVIAIIAILAAILFPVFAAAREKARQTTCASNEKQLALAWIQYVQDYDELGPGNWGGNNNDNQGGGYGWGNAIYPYVKASQVFMCPDFTTVYVNDNANYTYMMNLFLGCGRVYNGGGSGGFAGISGNGSFSTTPYGDTFGTCWGSGISSSHIDYPANTIMIFEGTSGYDTGAAYVNPAQVWLGSWMAYTSANCGGSSIGFNTPGESPALAQEQYCGDYVGWFSQIHSGAGGGMNMAFTDGHVKFETKAHLDALGGAESLSGDCKNGVCSGFGTYTNNGDVDFETK